jgi:pimeloyl-ACP methyl ester carboxylesterase
MTHGFGGTSLFYFHIIRDLREDSEIVLFDLRGMGLSDKLQTKLDTSE